MYKHPSTRSPSRGLERARSYNEVWHITGSDEDIAVRAIAMQCSELLTTQGHLAVRKTASENTTKLWNPTLRHAGYKHTRSIHVQCKQQVLTTWTPQSLQLYCICLYKSDIDRVHTEITWLWSNITTNNGSKLCLGIDKFNKWPREALFKHT